MHRQLVRHEIVKLLKGSHTMKTASPLRFENQRASTIKNYRNLS